MKFVLMAVLALFMTRGISKAEGTQATPTATWIDYNWTTVAHYGDPNDAAGLKASQEVSAQQSRYTAAKKAGNVDGMVTNAMCTSAKGWAFQNAGYALIKGITDVTTPESVSKATGAKPLFQSALDIINEAPTINNAEEKSQRQAVLEKAAKNLLFVDRILGNKPWPKESEDPDAAE